MTVDFETVHNHHEQSVYQSVVDGAARYPLVAANPALMADVACVALNRLPPRYIRHEVDLSFYLTEAERSQNESALKAAVDYAFGFVQSRAAMRARG